ncbi:DeoR family transcriptional regulator [uncultured Microscilla sp.]|uniref:DeoR family transcriptional regulator n=1 Tax=uncultured Microscilla sp. TaxID=432653 RepID=UPI0026053496|nr:DeoR family transcriptional regulator [uncultured Microscilla sp.]
MTIEELKQFFDERPSLSVNGVTLEAGLSESYLSKILRDTRPLSSKTVDKLKPVLKKYGYGCK